MDDEEDSIAEVDEDGKPLDKVANSDTGETFDLPAASKQDNGVPFRSNCKSHLQRPQRVRVFVCPGSHRTRSCSQMVCVQKIKPIIAYLSILTTRKQDQRVFAQKCRQICFRVLCESGRNVLSFSVLCVELPEGFTLLPEMTEETQIHCDVQETETETAPEDSQPPAAVEAPAVPLPTEIQAAAVIPDPAPVASCQAEGESSATGHVLPMVAKRQRRESKRLKHHKRRKKKTKIPIKRIKIKPLPPPPSGKISKLSF